MPGPVGLRRAEIPGAPASSGVLVDIVVLTGDLALFEAIREAVGERNPVWRARSAEESVDLLLTGRCGVLLVDLAVVSTRPDSLIRQVLEQFPDVVVCVAGLREDESLLAQLLSDGLVYRFMHKPLSSRRAGMFLQAAIRHHCERLEQATFGKPALSLVSALPSGLETWKWVFATIGVALFVMALAVLLGHRAVPEAAPAATAPAPSAPVAVAPKADPVLSSARAAFDAGRYESPAGRNALDLYKAVLLARPGQPEAEAGFEQTVLKLVQAATAAADSGHADEARRLVARVLAADPERRSAQALARRLETETAVANAVAPPRPPPANPASLATPAKTEPVRPVPVLATNPVAPAMSTVTNPLRVEPDPLTPRISNAAMLAAITPHSRPHAFGAPIDLTLPIAGYARPSRAETSTATAADSPQEPARTAGTLPAVPADSLDRIAVTDPVYPVQALRSRTTGWVEMEFTITESGAVRDIEVVQAEPRGVFEQAATAALGQWRFRPRVVNGQPVAQRSTVTLHFDVVG